MRLELVQFPNTLNALLPGLVYEPATKTDRIAIYLHGNGSSAGMYSVELQNTIGKALVEKGISYLTFTNTGGHLIQKFDHMVNNERVRFTGGTAYEIIKDCIGDIDGAVTFVQKRGYKHIYLIGSSTGANKICVYDFYKRQNKVEKYILLSGGDDSGIYYQDLKDKKFRLVLEKCKIKIEQGKGRDLVPKYFSVGIISYQSLFDVINPDGNYNIFPFNWELNHIKMMTKQAWREVSQITKPTLVAYGAVDEYCYGRVPDCVNLIKKSVAGKPNFQFEIIPDANHSFIGKRKELASTISNFVGNN